MKFCWFMVFCTFFLYLTGSQPTSSPHDSEDTQTTTSNSEVPLEFPGYNQNYIFVDNSSIRENFVSHSKNDTEVEDLLRHDAKPRLESLPTIINPTTSDYKQEDEATLVPNPSLEDEDLTKKNETEWLEDGNSNTEDVKTVVNEIISTKDNDDEYRYGYPLLDGQIAAILAGAFLVLAVIGYVVLLSWRRYLEGRYGSREMLVDEDDFIDHDDMKHFTI